MLPLCEQLNIAFIPYYPLACGLLTGKYQRDEAPPAGARLSKREQIATDEQWRLVEALTEYADERGVPLDRCRDRRAAGAAGGRKRDRRRDQARADREQRGGRQLDAERRGLAALRAAARAEESGWARGPLAPATTAHSGLKLDRELRPAGA